MTKVLSRLLALLLAFLLMECAPFAEGTQPAETAAPVDAQAEQPADAQAEQPADGEDGGPKPARAYVLVTTATQYGWLPLPEEGEVSYPLAQVLPDGTDAVNVIHLTPEGVYMEDSTCENHDCVGQGIVTLENRDERILGNMIICLPNQVCLQLFTPEEVLDMVKDQ